MDAVHWSWRRFPQARTQYAKAAGMFEQRRRRHVSSRITRRTSPPDARLGIKIKIIDDATDRTVDEVVAETGWKPSPHHPAFGPSAAGALLRTGNAVAA